MAAAGERLDDLPAEGRVLVASPTNEADVRRRAQREGLPYMLSAFVEPGRGYVIDVDEMHRMFANAMPWGS